MITQTYLNIYSQLHLRMSHNRSLSVPTIKPNVVDIGRSSIFFIFQRAATSLLFTRTILCSIVIILSFTIDGSHGAGRMVRLCIASVDPAKLSSQCVMCNRRDFPLTVIDCTGITKVNDLIANPLSVREATCLIYNCRRQVPDVKPEPYHGSVSQAMNYRGGAASNYPIAASGSQIYEMMPPSGFLGGGYSMLPPSLVAAAPSSVSPFMSRYGLGYRDHGRGSGSLSSSLSSIVPRSLIDGTSLGLNRNQPLQYAIVPAPNNFPFG